MTKIAVILAVFDPNPAFLQRQFASLFAQTLAPSELHIVVADCASQALVQSLCGKDQSNIHIHIPASPMSSVDAFKFGLTEALKGPCTHFAPCDQDDVWLRKKLETALKYLRKTNGLLVHSDARIVDETEKVTHSSLFRYERRMRRPGPRDLLYRNTVTGMTCLFTRSLAKTALPFPAQNGPHFQHDLWLALVACAKGALVFLDQPLVLYRQHAGNQIGARRTRLSLNIKNWVGQYGLARYLAENLAHRNLQTAALNPLIRSRSYGGSHIADAFKFALRMRLRLCFMAIMFAAIALGRKIWALNHTLTTAYPHSRSEFDRRLFTHSPGVGPPQAQSDTQPSTPAAWQRYIDKRMHPQFAYSFDRPHPRDVFFLPSLNPTECYAGIATAIDMGLKRMERGHAVTFIATDMPIANQAHTIAFLEKRAGRRMQDMQVEILCGRRNKQIAFHTDDRLFATAWWTAHLAHNIQKAGCADNEIFYIIQDYEPHFYPWGTEYAYARASYDLPHIPIFNSTYLRGYFAKNLQQSALKYALCFRPAIHLPDFQYTPAARSRKLILYGRPNVARNLFPLAVTALGQWLEHRPDIANSITLESVGENHRDITLPHGALLKSLGKLPWSEYPKYLCSGDIGLALMCSPHPSHLPLEMAAAGLQVVTNAFDHKDLSQLSRNIHSTCLTLPHIINALNTAWEAPNQDRLQDLSPLGPSMDDMLDALAQQTHIRTAA